MFIDVNFGVSSICVQEFCIVQKVLFVEDEWKFIECLVLIGGLCLDYYQVYGNYWSLCFYVVWYGSEQLIIKGGVLCGFKVLDICIIVLGYVYMIGGVGCIVGFSGICGVIIGDFNFKLEISISWELGVLWDNYVGFFGGVMLFYIDFKDKVSNVLVYNVDGFIVCWLVNNNYCFWISYNVDCVIIKGLELSGCWQVMCSLVFKMNYIFIDLCQKGGSYDGYVLVCMLCYMFNLCVDWILVDVWMVWIVLNYYGKEVNVVVCVGMVGIIILFLGVKEYQVYMLVDLGVMYVINQCIFVSVVIYNLIDKCLDEQSFNIVGDGCCLWVSLIQCF